MKHYNSSVLCDIALPKYEQSLSKIVLDMCKWTAGYRVGRQGLWGMGAVQAWARGPSLLPTAVITAKDSSRPKTECQRSLTEQPIK